MTKNLTNSAFLVASLIIILVFITARTYSQLAVAVVLYPAIVFLSLMIFPRKGHKSPKIGIQEQPKLTRVRVEKPQPKIEHTYIADIDKRTFIKLIGATGISFFLFSLFGRGVENLFFSRATQNGTNPLGNGDPFGPTHTSIADGLKISEIDEGTVSYFGFINKDGSWLIMREGEDGSSFRYAKGASDFPDNWKNRENLNYDYFHNL